MEIFLRLIFSVVQNMILYLWIPAAFIIIGKKLSRFTILIISIINFLIMYVLRGFFYLMALTYALSPLPAIIFCLIGHRLMISRISKTAPPVDLSKLSRNDLKFFSSKGAFFQNSTSKNTPISEENELMKHQSLNDFQKENSSSSDSIPDPRFDSSEKSGKLSQHFSQNDVDSAYMKQSDQSSGKKNIFPLVLVFVITFCTTTGIFFVLAQQNTDSFEIVQKRFIADQLSTQYDAGHDNGHRAGYEEGYEDGVEYGYGSGLTHRYYAKTDLYNFGYEDGYNVGFIEGHDEGYRDVSDDSNYDQGFDDGYDKCYSEYEDLISLSSLTRTIAPYVTIFIVILFFYLLMSRIIKLTMAPDASEKSGLVKRVFSALVIAVLVMIIIYLSQAFNFPPVYAESSQIASQETSRETNSVRENYR